LANRSFWSISQWKVGSQAFGSDKAPGAHQARNPMQDSNLDRNDHHAGVPALCALVDRQGFSQAMGYAAK
jgi:hypothetical protein